MQYVGMAVPLLVLAAIVAMILAPMLRGRMARAPRAPKPARPRRSPLRDVSRDQMDKDLNDLIRRS